MPSLDLDPRFVERMQGYAVKAAREGKQQTSWLAPDEIYETGLENFLQRLLDREHSAAFIASFDAFARRAALIGALKGLAQLAMKMTMPGTPDFYQGSEFWDLSLVDPDNRRPVDFAARASVLEASGDEPDWTALAATWPHGHIKFALMRRLLALRQWLADVFANGAYRPIEVLGPDRSEVLAFARVSGRTAVIVATGRRFARATHRGTRWPPGEAWNASLTVGRFSKIASVLGDRKAMTGPKLAVSDLFDALPVAVLQAQYMPARNERAGASLNQPAHA